MFQNLLDMDSVKDAFGIRECCLDMLQPSQLVRLNSVVRRVPELLNGAFFLRSTSHNGADFSIPEFSETCTVPVVAWSFILESHEVVCAVNLDQQQHAIVYVTIDDTLHKVDSTMSCLYASEISPAELNVEVRNGKCVRLTIPPHSLVIYN